MFVGFEPWEMITASVPSVEPTFVSPTEMLGLGWGERKFWNVFHDRPPRGLGNPRKAVPRENGLLTLETPPMVSAVSERVFRRCSKPSPNNCRFVSEKFSLAKDVNNGLIFFNTSSRRLIAIWVKTSPAKSIACFTHVRKGETLSFSSWTTRSASTEFSMDNRFS